MSLRSVQRILEAHQLAPHRNFAADERRDRADGEWYCVLTRYAELPEWLDQAVQTNHSDLSLALLNALIEAKDMSGAFGKPSIPSVQSTQVAHDMRAATISLE